MTLDLLVGGMLNGIQTLAVICNQWGDTGKGKFTDYFAQWADVIARGTGGNNAGHTVVVGDKKRIFHLIPSGIAYDSEGKINVLGNDMVLDMKVLNDELDDLDKGGMSYDNLMISEDAHVILPYHIDRDELKNKSMDGGGIGSTGRGIGPTYTDMVERRGIMVRDLFDKDRLAGKIRKRLMHYNTMRAGEWWQDVLHDMKGGNYEFNSKLGVQDKLDYLTRRLEKLGISNNHTDAYFGDMNEDNLKGYYESIAMKRINVEEETAKIIEKLEPLAKRVRPFVKDTIAEMHKFHAEGKKILLEGAQGLLLSYKFGTYPYVTSSDPSRHGTVAGVGLAGIDKVLGIVKFPMMTRVGGGPFPTEFGGSLSEEYCNEDAGEAHKVQYELTRWDIPFDVNEDNTVKYDHAHPKIIKLMNSNDPFEVGVGYRLAADEYGATTQRPRRTGRTDLAALKYAVGVNGMDVILTKVDVARGAHFIELGTGYEERDTFCRHPDVLYDVHPTYKRFDGFEEDISGVRLLKDLPDGLREAIAFTQQFAGCNVQAISVGPERNQTILKP